MKRSIFSVFLILAVPGTSLTVTAAQDVNRERVVTTLKDGATGTTVTLRGGSRW